MRLRPASRGFVHALRQPDRAIHGASLLRKHARGNAIEPEARFVQQVRRQNVRRAGNEILAAACHVVAVPGQRRKPGTAERLEQPPIGEAVSRHQIERAAECGVAAHVEVIRAIALSRRRHVVARRSRAVRARIERGNGTPDRMRQRRWQRVARGVRRHRADSRDAFVRTRALVVGEEKHSVTKDGTAEREADLRTPILGIGLVLRRKIVLRVECAVADERVRRAEQLVRARLQHNADLRRRLSAMRRPRACSSALRTPE